MTDFNAAFDVVVGKFEGFLSYDNHPADRGGETFSGIARKFCPTWPGWKRVDEIKAAHPKGFVQELQQDQSLPGLVKAFYKTSFWNTIQGDYLQDQGVALELFDVAVNMGTKRAGEFLQRALNLLNDNGRRWPDVAVDGRLGPVTLSRLEACLDRIKPRTVANTINALQAAQYVAICERDRTQEVFFIGWLSRVTISRGEG